MLTYPAITKRKLRAREHRERAIHDSWEGQGGFMQRWDLRHAGFQQSCGGGVRSLHWRGSVSTGLHLLAGLTSVNQPQPASQYPHLDPAT